MKRAIVVLLAALMVATSLAGCNSTPDPKTVAEARPELAVAYELSFRAWAWLDARNSTLYGAHSGLVIDAIKKHRAEFEAECGDQAPQCMLAVYKQVMAEWEAESGYAVRTRRLEVVREGLEAMLSVLDSDPDGGLVDWAPAVLKTLGAMSSLADELKASGVDIPDVVADGLAALKRLT